MRLEKDGALATFSNAEDCVAKIRQLLSDDETREKIAANGLEVALRDFNYRDIAHRVMEVVAEAHERKRPGLRGWR
jgi:spore maturation protein CgeB